MDQATRFDTLNLGGFPVIHAYFHFLKVADTINTVAPWDGDIAFGVLTEILMANRLLQPKPMYRIGQWAQQTGIAQYYGLTAEKLNDHLLGRVLERYAEHQHAVQAALTLNAIKRFDLRVQQIHYDISNAELYGAYEWEEDRSPRTPTPAYGRTKSGRKNVKQIQFGINVTRDGAVPVACLPLDGNAAESPTHLDNLTLLAKVLPKGRLIYQADSKLDAADNLLTIHAQGGQFLCGGVFHPHLQDEYLKRQDQLKAIAYFPRSQASRPPEQRDRYQACETREHLEGEVQGRKLDLEYRRIFVHSESKARQEAKTRQRRLVKLREEFATVEHNLNKYKLKTREAVIRRLEKAKGTSALGGAFHYEVRKARGGELRMKWRVDASVLQRCESLEGGYLLKTNLPKRSYPISRIMSEYKEQIQVERRIRDLKGPLAVTPLFLEKPERMAGLLCVLVWSLMVFSLIERQVRAGLKGKPLYGLYPENRPCISPTGKSILECFAPLSLVLIDDGKTTHRRLCEFSCVQQELIKLMGISSNTMKAFRRRIEK